MVWLVDNERMTEIAVEDVRGVMRPVYLVQDTTSPFQIATSVTCDRIFELREPAPDGANTIVKITESAVAATETEIRTKELAEVIIAKFREAKCLEPNFVRQTPFQAWRARTWNELINK